MTELDNVTVIGAEAATLVGTRPRIIGRNSHIALLGDKVFDPVVRLRTDAGVAGWGWSPATPDDAGRLVGKKLGEVFSPGKGTAHEFLAFDFPLWDLAGRLAGKPVHAMLGDAGPDPVPVYDGSIYIDELDPDTGRDDGIQPMLDAVKMGVDAGFRAFKVKIGRCFVWMEPESGLKRDVEVLHAIRRLIGSDMRLLVDANNGYTPNQAREVMRQAGECDIFWFEEPFPENRRDCLEFKEFLREGGWQTLVADGETRSRSYSPEFAEIVRAGGIDVVQFDLRGYTLTRWLEYMPVIEETGALAAPHNWGSHLSGFYIPQFARGVGHFAMGETDTSAMPEVSAEGYGLEGGMRNVPDAPGFGLQLDDSAFARLVEGDGGWRVGRG